MWRLLTSNHHEQKRLELDKIILLPIKVDLSSEKQRETLKQPFHPLFLHFTPPFPIPGPSPGRVDGACYIRYIEGFLCCSFHLTLSPCSSKGFPWTAVPPGISSCSGMRFMCQSLACPHSDLLLSKAGHEHLIHCYKHQMIQKFSPGRC